MPIITYEDAARRLQQFLGGTDLVRGNEDVKLAVSMAYEGLTSEHDWRYYHTEWGFNTVASVDTTVTYTHSTLKAVLATAVSSWAVYGKLNVGNIIGEVDTLNTASNPATLVMSANINFNANVAAGTSATLFQSHFTLPELFRSIDQPLTSDGTAFPLHYITPAEYVRLLNTGSPTGEAGYYTIMQDPENIGRMALFLYPGPSTVKSYRLPYIRAPRPLWFSGSESASSTGTVTVSSGGVSVTGTSTTFDERMEGSVIRLGNSTTHQPTDQHGPYPYINQRVIRTWSAASGAGALTLDAATTQAFSGVRFRISDPIDIDPCMIPAFYSRCRLELANLRPETHTGKMVDLLRREYERLFKDARGTDHKLSHSRRTGDMWHGADWWDLPLGDDDVS